jgi:hypothetical protein
LPDGEDPTNDDRGQTSKGEHSDERDGPDVKAKPGETE